MTLNGRGLLLPDCSHLPGWPLGHVTSLEQCYFAGVTEWIASWPYYRTQSCRNKLLRPFSLKSHSTERDVKTILSKSYHLFAFQLRFELPAACDLINAAFSGEARNNFLILKKKKSPKHGGFKNSQSCTSLSVSTHAHFCCPLAPDTTFWLVYLSTHTKV